MDSLTMHLSASQGLICVSTTVPDGLVVVVELASPVLLHVAPPFAGKGLSQERVLVWVLLAVALLQGPQLPQPPAKESNEAC